jgi:localization factor PodJL
MYEQGLGIPRDIGKAIGLYELAAEAEEFLARVELGRIYSRGKDVAASAEKALRWYSAAVALQDRVEDCEEIQEARAYLKQGTGK